MATVNQNPEQIARDLIDKMLVNAGWVVQFKDSIDLYASTGVAVREYRTDIGPADYILFVDSKPVGVIEAKNDEEGQHLWQHEQQAEDYAKSKLKHLGNQPLPFVYTSTGTVSLCNNIGQSLEKARALRHSIQKIAFEGDLLSEEELTAYRAEPDYCPVSELLTSIKGDL